MDKCIEMMKRTFYDKKIIVTGGTGSIGEQIVASLLLYKPKLVVVFNRDDSKQYLMKLKYAHHSNIEYYLGDIREYSTVEKITRETDIVFHAAALKHVSICEKNPFEAVKTNVIGSENLIQASIINKVKKVINISTDKAVNPTNTMGITKLIAEKLFKQANYMNNNKGTIFASVRFGNVIGSRGSVVPIFMELAKSGKPLTITDPRMTRFFMTIPEAVNITLKAAHYSKGGEVFVFKMKALRINDLAEAVKEYSKKNGTEVLIENVGIRPGEKLFEELMSHSEMENVFEDDQLYAILPSSNTSKYWHFKPSKIAAYRSDQVDAISKKSIISILNKLESKNGDESEEKK